MKNTMLTMFFAFVFSVISAQSEDDNIAQIDRKTLIEEYLQLSESDSRKFWKVYEEYYKKVEKNNNERFERFESFLENDSIPERELRKMVKVNSYVKQLDAMLLEQYYEILRKRISPEVAGKFYHFEDAMNSIALAERYKQWNVFDED
ncbi:hypothetical protein [Abyssalbus ytuae]|uniref:Uncharacterized protein n=1 Tax=Abyssalbus ytuae TaxID=2926907 RepID=A0A9E6ZSR8_9FLAO|nr:hypothetical protein [Abyssalbus ytuae]UOB16006.1 hypothetical protein MQE35_09665 [Abyssalbus ytuae]